MINIQHSTLNDVPNIQSALVVSTLVLVQFLLSVTQKSLREGLQKKTRLPCWFSGKESPWQCRFLGWEDPLEKEMATHSILLDWEIRGQRRLVGSSPQGRKSDEYSDNHTEEDTKLPFGKTLQMYKVFFVT